MEKSRLALVVQIGLLVLTGCGGAAQPTTPPTASASPPPTAPAASAGPTSSAPASPTPTEVGTMAFTLTSSAFTEGGSIPTEYTCDGANKAVPLAWAGAPEGTRELALVLDDPDARGYVHWVVVGIPPSASSLGGGAPLPAGAREGRRSGGAGYTGPCPPSGTHRYVFTLYALSSNPTWAVTPTAADVRQFAAGVTLATATLTGNYKRGG